MNVADIVKVNITKQTKGVSRAGFGTLLILGDSAVIPVADRIRYYDSITAVDADFAATDKEYLAALSAFSQELKPSRVAIGRRDGVTPETWVEALAAIRLVSDDFYGVMTTERTKQVQLDLAAAVEAMDKIFLTASAEAAIINTTLAADTGGGASLAAQVKAAAYERTGVMYHQDAGGAGDVFPEAAWFGRMLPTDPGAATWKFKTLAGVPVSNLTPSQSKNARDKSANTYETVGGRNITLEGTAGSGEFLDTMVGVDWLKSTISARVFGRFVNLPKVPYTDAGVAVVEAELKASLDAGVAAGFLASDPAPVIIVPKVKDVDPNDRAARFLPDVQFTATLAGAVHSTQIDGVVSV